MITPITESRSRALWLRAVRTALPATTDADDGTEADAHTRREVRRMRPSVTAHSFRAPRNDI